MMLYLENLKFLKRNKDKQNNIELQFNFDFDNNFSFKWYYLVNIDDTKFIYMISKVY